MHAVDRGGWAVAVDAGAEASQLVEMGESMRENTVGNGALPVGDCGQRGELRLQIGRHAGVWQRGEVETTAGRSAMAARIQSRPVSIMTPASSRTASAASR